MEGGGVEQATVDIALAVAHASRRSLVASRGGRLEGALARGGAGLVRLPVHSRNPLTMAVNAARLARVIARERVSLVHVRSRAPAFSALAAARLAGVPLIATYHGVYGARSPAKRWYNGIMTRGEVVIANSRFTRDHILAQHHPKPCKVVVIPEGIDTETFDPAAVSQGRIDAVRAGWEVAPGEERQIVLVAARLTSWKGHRVIIDALAARRDVLLILAGASTASPYAAALTSLALSRGLIDHVRLVGPCEDMPAAYRLADLVAAPSTAAESFGRAVAEAGAMERVVLASRLGGPAETIVDGRTGWLVAPGDVGAWAACLERALRTGRAERAAMGAAARARVTGLYGLAAMSEATFEVYRRVLEHRQ
ncbi:MAG: glycosyltransferase [Pseudomonadota bacterium]